MLKPSTQCPGSICSGDTTNPALQKLHKTLDQMYYDLPAFMDTDQRAEQAIRRLQKRSQVVQ